MRAIALPIISEIPVIGPVLFTQNIFVYGMYVLVASTAFGLFRTRWGLRTRSVGEHPEAADTVGIKVYSMKYLNVILGGLVAGFGGAYFTLGSVGRFDEGMTAGRGFIGLAAMIFGNWRPTGVGAAAGLFGYANALNLRVGPAVHALLLFAAVALGALGLWYLYRRRVTGGVPILAIAGLTFLWYVVTDTVPREFIFITPYVATLLVLAVASQRLRPPEADGARFRRGQQRTT
jgi:simple sugar transport system permease protein